MTEIAAGMAGEDALRERMLGGLWGALVGDALGVPVEFAAREERRRDPVTGMRGYGTHHQPPGTWSDDGSLLLCTVEALHGDYDPARLGALFVAWEAQGYWTPHGSAFDMGIATGAALGRIRRGVPPEEAGGVGERDNGNGSLMRILPVALRYASEPTGAMLELAHRVSAVTHRHPRSQMACGLYCCMAKGLLAGLMPREAYRAMIEDGGHYLGMAPFAAESAHFDRVLSGALAELGEGDIASGGYVVHTLEASLWCLLTTDSFEDAVLTAVNLGDDTDTTGCVAGGLAGLAYGLSAIPAEWRAQLARCEAIADLFGEFVTRHVRAAEVPEQGAASPGSR